MIDIAHIETERLIEKVERQVRIEYARAAKEVERKLNDYMQSFLKKDAVMFEKYKQGQITEKELYKWREGQIAVGKRWQEMKESIAQDYHNANMIARSIVQGYLPDAYALNHNYATFLVEKGALVDTSYSLYSRQAVERLIKNEPDILPQMSEAGLLKLKGGKDVLWQKGQVQSLMTQAILQGESIPEIASKVSVELGVKNKAAAVRYARTAMTGSQNAGRNDAYHRARDLGIKLKQTWLATLDGRTRDEHVDLDGQTVGIDEPFEIDGYEIAYPGDPGAEPFLVWNCRCTTIPTIEGFERDLSDLSLRESSHLEGMSYSEWKEAHKRE